MSKVRIGVVGCGAIHTTHADAIRGIEEAELVGFCDTVKEKGKAASEKYGVPSFTRLSSLLEKCDAVTVAVPSGDHHRITLAAAKAGRHVLSEKPIDVTYQAAKKMVDACEEAGVVFSVVSQHRFSDDIRRVRQGVIDGEFGRMVMADGATKWYRSQAYYDSGDWRGTWKLDGGGCLMNQGVHYMDMLQWVMGGVESVQAQFRTLTHDIEVEDVLAAIIQFKNGAIGTYRGATSVFPGLSETLEIHGEFGTAIIEGDRLKVWDIDEKGAVDGSPYGRGIKKQPTPKLDTMGDKPEGATGAADPTAIWGEQHRLQIQDFCRAILDNRAPEITGRDALEPLKCILAIYKSGRMNGRVVRLDSI
ncbi:MAG: Gfo/Idh/MocA family oxidoreductase, partial [Fimbriimonadaceae bacterium]|nr:Gfo/Idh/MocA family oxidoreductase [Fimbriimonadaceae bacterium]